jgi:predicted short-subunit dehydrogenase-like oxidoreductase (DUF2520 family)
MPIIEAVTSSTVRVGGVACTERRCIADQLTGPVTRGSVAALVAVVSERREYGYERRVPVGGC